MQTIKIIFTKSPWSVVSWIVRWALPRSRFALGLSSHCYILNEETDFVYEADLFEGVRYKNRLEAMRGTIVVATREFSVISKQAGFDFLNKQIGKKYDLKGSIGLGLKPERDWEEDDAWFCYELAAAALKAAGFDVFENVSHVNETVLLSLKT